MSTRKNWRFKKYPSFRYQTTPSMRRTYELVDYYRRLYAEGMAHVHQIDVEVDEGDGWRLYERLVFERKDAS